MAKLITNARALSAVVPPKLRNKKVQPGWETDKGEQVEFCLWELNQREFAEMQKEAAEDASAGINRDMRLIAWCGRDEALPAGNRIWPDTKDAIAFLSSFSWADIQVLADAANEVNGPRAASAEGNSPATGTEDSSSNSG